MGWMTRSQQLRGLPFFDDLPEVRCHLAIVMSKHLIEGLLGPVRRQPSPLLALGGFGLVLLRFGLKINLHGTTPRNTHNSRQGSLARATARKDGRAKEILQREDQLALSIVDALPSGV
jgi:hypothetical protein